MVCNNQPRLLNPRPKGIKMRICRRTPLDRTGINMHQAATFPNDSLQLHQGLLYIDETHHGSRVNSAIAAPPPILSYPAIKGADTWIGNIAMLWLTELVFNTTTQSRNHHAGLYTLLIHPR